MKSKERVGEKNKAQKNNMRHNPVIEQWPSHPWAAIAPPGQVPLVIYRAWHASEHPP